MARHVAAGLAFYIWGRVNILDADTVIILLIEAAESMIKGWPH